MKTLRERMIDDMQLRRLSKNTQAAYLFAVRELAKHYMKPPEQLGTSAILDYILYLQNTRKLAWSTIRVVIAALKFCYGVTLNRPAVVLAIPERRTPHRLPEILNPDELQRLFAAARKPLHRTILMTMYATGMRASEVVRLQARLIDSGRMVIRVEGGKGEKDRYVPLSPTLLEELRAHWKRYHPEVWLFPSFAPGHPHDPPHRNFPSLIFNQAKRDAGIQKKGGSHTLRHCFATHMLEAGVDLHTIKEYLGHKSILTTALYLRLARPHTAQLSDLLRFTASPGAVPPSQGETPQPGATPPQPSVTPPQPGATPPQPDSSPGSVAC